MGSGVPATDNIDGQNSWSITGSINWWECLRVPHCQPVTTAVDESVAIIGREKWWSSIQCLWVSIRCQIDCLRTASSLVELINVFSSWTRAIISFVSITCPAVRWFLGFLFAWDESWSSVVLLLSFPHPIPHQFIGHFPKGANMSPSESALFHKIYNYLTPMQTVTQN